MYLATDNLLLLSWVHAVEDAKMKPLPKTGQVQFTKHNRFYIKNAVCNVIKC
jgi:hypothetical protein